tara:strand:- start:105 stop:764 length:660 start_codon:yes stop_codon:yes gene_type:complete
MTLNDMLSTAAALVGGGAGIGAILQYLSNKRTAKRLDFETIKDVLIEQINSEQKSNSELRKRIQELEKKLHEYSKKIDNLQDEKQKIDTLLHLFTDVLDLIPVPIWIKKINSKGDFVMTNINTSYENEFLFPLNRKRIEYINKPDNVIFDKKTAEKFKEGDLKVFDYKTFFWLIETNNETGFLKEWIFLKFPVLNSTQEVIGVGGIGIKKTKQLMYLLK